MIVPISVIVVGALTWLGNGINNHFKSNHLEQAQKVELMKELCFQHQQCEPLVKYLEEDTRKAK